MYHSRDAGEEVPGEKHNFPRRFGVDQAPSEGWVFLNMQLEPAKPADFKKRSLAARHQNQGCAWGSGGLN